MIILEVAEMESTLHNVQEGINFARQVGFPISLFSCLSLKGGCSDVVYNMHDFSTIFDQVVKFSQNGEVLAVHSESYEF